MFDPDIILTDVGWCMRNSLAGYCEFVDFESVDWSWAEQGPGGGGGGGGGGGAQPVPTSTTVPTQTGETTTTTTTTTTKTTTATTTTTVSKPCSGDSSMGSMFEDNPIHVTSGFGNRTRKNGAVQFHSGWDLRAKEGTTLVSSLPGKVVFADLDGDSGAVVRIDGTGKHAGLRAGYGHMSSIDVKVGDPVSMGTPIGKSGGRPGTWGAGSSENPHLHYTVKLNGSFINPRICYP